MKSHENLHYKPGMKLCPREGEALVLAALGHSTKESGRIMNVAPSTVKGYLDSAREKLNARNVAHAVSLAWQLSLIGGKYLSLILFMFAILHCALIAGTDQRSPSRPVRTARASRSGRNGRRDGESSLLTDTPTGADPILYIGINHRSLTARARSAA
jgi:DNA-binding CsgD family transcriptional regulator